MPLLAIPFFILTGNLMNRLEMTRRIFDFINAALGSLRGGLAQVNVVACMVFGGISGSALADLAGVGTMVIHAMTRAGYRAEFSAALTVSSSLLAPILPPSIMFIIYAVLMNVSVGQMFAAGILPGIVLAAILLINNRLLGQFGIERFPAPVRTPLRQVLRLGLRGLPGLLTPLVILRSMVSGLATPTEASIVAVCYTLLLGALFRETTLARLREAFVEYGPHDGADHVPHRHRQRDGIRADLRPGRHPSRPRHRDDHAGQMGGADIGDAVAAGARLFPGDGAGAADRGAAVRATGDQFWHRSHSFRRRAHLRPAAGHHPSAGRPRPVHGLRITRLRLEAVVRASLLFYPALMLALILFMFVPALSTWLPTVLFGR